MKWLIALLLLLPTEVFGLEVELAVGRSEFCCLENGIWWQSQFGFTGNTRSLAYEIGARQRFGNWSVAGRYSDLGTASGNNTATMRDDDVGRYDPSQPCNPSGQHNCLGRFNVSQHIQAVMIGGAYRFTINGVGVEPEVGTALYQSNTRVSITCQDCGMGHRYAFGAGGTFSGTSAIRRSPYMALRLTFKDITLTYRRINHIDGNSGGLEGIEAQFNTGLTNGPVNQLLIGASF